MYVLCLTKRLGDSTEIEPIELENHFDMVCYVHNACLNTWFGRLIVALFLK